jgi:hypothetical protein
MHGLVVADIEYAFFEGRWREWTFVKHPYELPLNPFDPDFSRNYDYHPRYAGHWAIACTFLRAAGYKLHFMLPVVGK